MTWISRIDKHKITDGYAVLDDGKHKLIDGYVMRAGGLHKWTKEEAGEKIALLIDGYTFNNRIKTLLLANAIKEIRFYADKPAAGVNTVNLEYSTSDYEILGYVSGTAIYVYTPADKIHVNQDLQRMFWGLTNLTTVNAETLYRELNIVSANYAFYNCQSLTSIDLSTWEGNPATASDMFGGCTMLRTINLAGWDLSALGSLFGSYSNFFPANVRTLTTPAKLPAFSISLHGTFTDGTNTYTDLKNCPANTTLTRV